MPIVGRALRRILPLLACAALPALAALAQPTVESVTSTAVREKQIQQYVDTQSVASRIAGKIGRWENPICVKAEGLKPELLDFVVRRVKAVAVQVGARVNNDPACRQNVEIGFASNPQSVADYLRDKHSAYLGFFNNTVEAARMARMTHPIQAWYATVTIDANNEVQSDQKRRDPPECFDPPLCRVMISAPVQRSTGTRVSDGMRTGFRNVIVLADRDRLVKMEMGTVADYIAFLVLAQPASLDDCMGLPSILNSLAPKCTTVSGELSAADIAYLTALYRMNTDRLLAGQKEQLAFHMKKALGTR